MIRIALTKGRLEKKSVELFESCNIECKELVDKGRKLLFTIGEGKYEVVLAKAADVLTYVEHGVCDVGIVGKDTIMEYGKSFYEMLDLGFGRCKFVLATKKETDFYEGYTHKKIATKYPEVAKGYFSKKGIDVEIIKIEGSVELAPILALADGIVDIMETGDTIRENGLKVVEELYPVSARLIVNIASMKMKKKETSELINTLKAGVSNA